MKSLHRFKGGPRRSGWGLLAGFVLSCTLAAPARASEPEPELATEAARDGDRCAKDPDLPLCFLEPGERARLPKVEPLRVPSSPVLRTKFATTLANACADLDEVRPRRFTVAASAVDAPTALAGLHDGSLRGELNRLDTDASVAEVRRVAEALAVAGVALARTCNRIETGERLTANEVGHLRDIYADGARQLAALVDVLTNVAEPLEVVLEPAATEADARDFVDALTVGPLGTPQSMLGGGSLGAVASRVFGGLAEFLIDRAREEALGHVRDRLEREVCQTDPGVFLERSCQVLGRDDSGGSLAALGASLHAAVLVDLDHLVDKLVVFASARVPTVAYPGTVFRVAVALARDTRAKRDPLDFVTSLAAIEPLICEQTVGSATAIPGDRECADTMAALRLGSATTRAVLRQQGSDDAAAFVVLGSAFALELEVGQIPAVARDRLAAMLPALPWTGDAHHRQLRFDAETLAHFRDLIGETVAVIQGVEGNMRGMANRDAPPSAEDMLAVASDACVGLMRAGESGLALARRLKDAQATSSTRSTSSTSSTRSMGGVLAAPAPAATRAPPAGGADLSRLEQAIGSLDQRMLAARDATDGEWGSASLAVFDQLIDMLEDRADPGRHGEALAALEQLRRYLPLFIEIANAESSADVAAALEAAFPAGGYKLKYRQGTVAINAFLGGYGGALVPLGGPSTVTGETAMFAPVGVHVSTPIDGGGGGRPWNVGLMVAVIDVGAITTSKWLTAESEPEVDDGTATVTDEPGDFNIAGVLSPGAYLTFGIAQSPFTLGLGASVNPFAQKQTTTTFVGGESTGESSRFIPAVRAGAFVAVDITMVAFGLRKRRSR